MDIKDLAQLSSSAYQPVTGKKENRKNDQGEATRETSVVGNDRIRISDQSYRKLQKKKEANELLSRTSERNDTGALDDRLTELKREIQQGAYLNTRRDAEVSRKMFSIWSDDEPIE